MDGLKQRIIGALVLICLAIIFVPMLFDEPHDKQTTKTIEIPNKPQYPVMTIEQPQKPATAGTGTSAPVVQGDAEASTTTAPADTSSDQAGSVEPASKDSGDVTPAPVATTDTATPAQTAPAPAPAPATQAQPAPASAKAEEQAQKPEFSQSLKGAWIIQLGSFGDAKNAQRLRDSVRAKGYPAYLQTAHAGSKTLTRVFSGPFVQKADAETAKTKLDKTFKINSLVMSGDK